MSLSDVDVIKTLIKSPEIFIRDYRITNDTPFEGLLIPCTWDIKDDVRNILVEALKNWIAIKEFMNEREENND